MEFFKKLWSEDDGQGLVEYGLLVALVVGLVIAALVIFGDALTALFEDIETKLSGVVS